MTRADPNKTVLVTGFLVSTMLHVTLWGVASGFVRIGKDDPKAEVQAHKRTANAPPEEPRIHLGIDDSKADTLTWLGYAEATENAGEVSKIEQSSMSPQAGSPADPAPPAPQTAAAPKLTEPTIPSVPITSTQVQEAAEATAGVGQKLAKPIQTAAAKEKTTPPPQPAPAKPPGSNGHPGSPGLPADKEAAASAIKKAPTVIIGQALAAEGLDIQTKSPRWGMTTMQTRRPANPTVQITFGRDGKVIRAGFASDGTRMYSTGYDDVDEPLLSAIYTWTARGKHLAELTSKDPAGEVTILITIILRG